VLWIKPAKRLATPSPPSSPTSTCCRPKKTVNVPSHECLLVAGGGLVSCRNECLRRQSGFSERASPAMDAPNCFELAHSLLLVRMPCDYESSLT